MPDALAGLRVLDLATLYPAPLVAAMLGDLGADVVKVEATDGDPMRRTGRMQEGRSLVWALVGRNKRSVRVDLDAMEGLDLVQRLTGVADAVVLNQPRTVLERWGCTYEDIAARNPRAVVIAVSAYGADGPYADRAGNGTLAEAFAGVTHMIGEPDGPPVLPSLPLGDHLGAVTGLAGALAALYWRDARGGEGQLVDVSLTEAVLPLLGPAMVAWPEGDEPPARSGSRVAGAAPRNVYRTGDDRWVAVSGTTPSQVARVMELIGADPPPGEGDGDDIDGHSIDGHSIDGHSIDGHSIDGHSIDGQVARWIEARDADSALAALLEIRIPAAEVSDLAQVVGNEHLRARESVLEIDDPGLGRRRMPAPAPRLSRTPGRVTHTGPALGADTDAVVRDWLGS